VARGLRERAWSLFREADFRGKGRLRRLLPVPQEGVREISLPEGLRLRLDLRETIQQDYFFGLYDRLELRLVGRFLADGGDFVDVGAHIGVYSIYAHKTLRGRGRVIAFEPNPDARGYLAENLALNGCEAVLVSPVALSDRAGEAVLHVPASFDRSWSSLDEGKYEEGRPVTVTAARLDDELSRHGLRPALVKIDVEGHELRVLEGMERTLDDRPAILCEVSERTAADAWDMLTRLGYESYRVRRTRLEPGLGSSTEGIFNVFFVPSERAGVISRS
jgi:FkbM family methyltransferase